MFSFFYMVYHPGVFYSKKCNKGVLSDGVQVQGFALMSALFMVRF